MANTALLVDYDPRRIAKTRSWLHAAGLEVRLARDGEVAIRTFREWRPDVVVLEDLLPKRHGFEVCRAIKEIAEDAPVVLLTDGRNGRRYAVLETGCDAFVQKPVRESELLDAIRAHVALRDETSHVAPVQVPVPAAAPRPMAASAPAPDRSPAFVLPERIDEDDIDAMLDAMLVFGSGAGEASSDVPASPVARTRRKPATRKKVSKKKTSAKKATRKTTAKKNTTKKKTSKKTTSRPTAKKKTQSSASVGASAKPAKKKVARKRSPSSPSTR